MLTPEEENKILRAVLKQDIVDNHLPEWHRMFVRREDVNDIKSNIGRLSKKTGISKEKILEFTKSFIEELFQEPLDQARSKLDSITFES